MKSAAATHPSENELRAFALSFPEAREEFPWGESAFKVKGKVFVFVHVHAEGLNLSLKLPLSHETALAQPFAEPTGYGLGKSGWVTSKFEAHERVPMDLVKRWIEESYRAVAPKKLVALLAGPKPPAAAVPRAATGRPAREQVTRKPARASKSAPTRARKKR